MRDFSRPRLYIVSAYRGKNAHQDHMNHCDLSCDLALAGFPFREVTGEYDGKREASYLVTGVRAGPTVAALARLHEQECYLVIAENDRTAYFVDPRTGYHTHAGKFTCAGNKRPDGPHTELDGTYWVITPTEGTDLPEGL